MDDRRYDPIPRGGRAIRPASGSERVRAVAVRDGRVATVEAIASRAIAA